MIDSVNSIEKYLQYIVIFGVLETHNTQLIRIFRNHVMYEAV